MSETNTHLSGRDLDIAIAKAMGYTVYHYSKSAHGYYQLWNPHGAVAFFDSLERLGDELREKGYRASERETEAQAWLDAPEWTEDVGLVIGECWQRKWYISFSGTTVLIAYPIGDSEFSRTHRGDGDDPWEAAARALLAALEANA